MNQFDEGFFGEDIPFHMEPMEHDEAMKAAQRNRFKKAFNSHLKTLTCPECKLSFTQTTPVQKRCTRPECVRDYKRRCSRIFMRDSRDRKKKEEKR